MDDENKAGCSSLPIRTRLRSIAAQQGCDGEPYDTMQEASDYIEMLERKLSLMPLREVDIAEYIDAWISDELEVNISVIQAMQILKIIQEVMRK